MAKFDADILLKSLQPLDETLRFSTLKSRFENGAVQRKKKKLYPTRDYVLEYKRITKVEMRTVWQFYIARGGAYQAFNIFLPWTNTYEGEYVGVGDGSTVIFNLPCEGSSGRTLYVNGVSQDEGSSSADEYEFSAAGGNDGADKITFAAAPADGEKITLDFSGNLKVRVTFEKDDLNFKSFMDTWASVGINLLGELNQ